MSDKYSTIQQHQPLRVPSSFDKQGKALIVQLDEIFDDIYRRFGRLRLEDMGKAFRQKIEDDEGNIADLQIDADRLFAVVQNQDGDISGITIKAVGIDLSGSKYIKLTSGTSLVDVEATKIELSSGETKVIIDPTQLNMNTTGLVSILGQDNSIIKLMGGTGNDQTIFQADSSGYVQAVKLNSSEISAATMNVTDLKVTGQLDADLDIPNIVVASSQPSGHGIIWLEPSSGVITPYSYTQAVADAETSAWSVVTANTTWSQTCNLGSVIDATGAKKLKLSGVLYKNGSTAAWDATLTAVANLSDSSTIDLGTVGTFPYMQSLKWDYGFSKEITISAAIAANIVSITFTFTLSRTTDATAYLSYPHNMTLICSGETGSGSSDECTVHYIA